MKKALHISLSMWIMLVYMGQIVLTDNLMYFAKMGYAASALTALTIGIVFNGYLLRSGNIRISFQYHKWDLVFYLFLLAAIFVDIGFADTSYDTYMYHLYLQENPFGVDKIYSDFFPGRTLTSFVFAVADRCFYPFRHLLGYRLGTLPSYLILIPLFYGIKRLLRYLVPQISERALSLFSVCPLCSFVVLYQAGSYLIDNFSIVLLLEIMVVVLTSEPENGLLSDRRVLIYLAWLTGLAVGVKYINAIYLIGVFLCVLVRDFFSLKYIKWHDHILAVFLFVLPMLPYLADCWRQTGSPVFPYYNTVFHSPYFADVNWLDQRYGPKNFPEFLIWPLYIIVNPTRANDFQNGLTDFSFAAGYVIIWGIIGSAVYRRFSKKKPEMTETNHKMLFYAGILLYGYWVWEKFIIGYVRYGGIILVMSTCLTIWWLYEGIWQKLRWKVLTAGFSLTASVMIGMLFFCIYGGPRYYACALSPRIASVLKEDAPQIKIAQSFTCLWRDRSIETYDIDGVWGVVGDDSLSTTLLNHDDPMVYLEFGHATGETDLNRDIYLSHVRGQQIYIPLYGSGAEAKRAILAANGFEVKEVVAVLDHASFLQGDQTVEIVRAEYVR